MTKLDATGSALVYSTYLGGNNVELSGSIAVDTEGNALVTGTTSSPNFPTVRPLQASLKGAADAFVAKLGAAGNTLIYSTYLGGGAEEIGTGIAVDAASNAYLIGLTVSTDFPTANALQATFGGGTCSSSSGSTSCSDAFVARLNADGTMLVYATYLGGNQFDFGNGIAVGADGQVYVTGTTSSANFPVRNAWQQNLAGGVCGANPCSDAFVTRLDTNAAGAASLVYSTYLGGGRGDLFGNSQPSEASLGIAVDSTGNAYVTGITGAHDFPLKNPLQNIFAGGKTDAFVTRLNTNAVGAASLVYSTYLGGSDDENALNLVFSVLGASNRCIAADAAGNAYVTGTSLSVNFPILNPAMPGFGDKEDAFVTKLNTNAAGAASLVHSTYLGGDGSDAGLGIAVDTTGNIYVTGITDSADFPVVNPRQRTLNGTVDAFITKIGESTSGNPVPTLAGLSPSSAAAGGPAFTLTVTGNNFINGAVVRWSGADRATSFVSATQLTASITAADIAAAATVSVTVFNPAPGGGASNALNFTINSTTIPVTSVLAASYGATLAPEAIAAAFGSGLATAIAIADRLPLPTSLAGTSVKIKDSAGVERLAPLFFVSPGQINYQVPPETATGAATVTVTSGDGRVSTGTAQIAAAAPGLFAANANAQGVAAGLALRVRNGVQSLELIAQWDAAQGRMVPLQLDLGPATDEVYLILFGTGFRYASSLAAVTARIGNTDGQVLYAGPAPGFIGLDQLNLRVSRSLAGCQLRDIVLTVDGRSANIVQVSIKNGACAKV